MRSTPLALSGAWLLSMHIKASIGFAPPLRAFSQKFPARLDLLQGDKPDALQPNDDIENNRSDGQNSTEFTTTNGNPEDFESQVYSNVLTVTPETIEVVRIDDEDDDDNGRSALSSSFVPMFRGSANYIANHRDTIAVIHIPGGLLDQDKNFFRDLMNDVALTWLLGMKIVLVVGCQYQIDQRIPNRDMIDGMLVTDEEALRVVKEEAGYVRFEVERQLARCLRSHQARDGNVVSGNFFSAQPFGILNGVDYQYTGFPRRVEVEKIRQVHAARDICLLTPVGVSPSGEVYNVKSENLAASVAKALDASKIIYLTEKKVILRNTYFGNRLQSLRLSDAKNLLDHRGILLDRGGFVRFREQERDSVVRDLFVKIGCSISALQSGVKRAHILNPTQGALLQELYTRDGSGTLISRDLYEGIRQATANDVVGISDLIQPLIQMGTLVDRPKATLEKEIDTFYVYTREDLVVACGQLKKFENGFAEIGCLVVRKEYRSHGRGDSMLGYLERKCMESGYSTVFVLSTQTMEWFVERGFNEVRVGRLPPSRQSTYNYDRRSKIYMKEIKNIRDLDASELWWNR